MRQECANGKEQFSSVFWWNGTNHGEMKSLIICILLVVRPDKKDYQQAKM